MLAWCISVVRRRCPVMRRREAMERRMQSTSKLLLLGVLLAGVLVGARVALALEVGEEAPDFTLSSTLAACRRELFDRRLRRIVHLAHEPKIHNRR